MCAGGRTVGEPRLSSDATRIAFVATQAGRADLVVIDLDGGHEQVVTTTPSPLPARAYGGGTFDWVPDGSGLVYAADDGGLWLQPVAGGPPRRLVGGGGGRCAAPAVAPDGTRVAYVVDTRDVAVVEVRAGGRWPVRLSADADFALDPAWSPDGAEVAWHEWSAPAMAWDASRIVVAPADGSRPPVVVAGGDDRSVGQPRYSPDGAGSASSTTGPGSPTSGRASRTGPVPRRCCPGRTSTAGRPGATGSAAGAGPRRQGRRRLPQRRRGLRRPRRRGPRRGRPPAPRARHPRRRLVVRWAPRRRARRCEDADPDRRVRGPRPRHPAGVARGPVAGFEVAALVEPEVVTWSGADGSDVHGRLYAPSTSTMERLRRSSRGCTAGRPTSGRSPGTPASPSGSMPAGRCSCPTTEGRRGTAGPTPRPWPAGGGSSTSRTSPPACVRRGSGGGGTHAGWWSWAGRRAASPC
jgi:dipeptidyl aminopeptidase/acylaminoacyl peptidase